jgi:ATP-dependent DNA helicase DinG
MLESLDQSLQPHYRKIAENLPNFKMRHAQVHMIQAVFETLSRAQEDTFDEEKINQQGESLLVVEGPTGTGKSLGYLLPAILAAKAKQKRLIISSATVLLQEQLAQKDIPFVAQHAGLAITFVIAKGRSRYLCPERLHHLIDPVQQGDWLGQETEILPWATDPNIIEMQILKRLAQNFENEIWLGDRDSLSESVSDPLWNRITNDRHGCLKKDCRYFKKCPFFLARAKLEETDIIIANHDLLLADVSMGGGVILPHLADSFYCIDEGHRFADKAIQQFAGSHSILGTLRWLEKIPGLIYKIETTLKESKWHEKINEMTETIAGILHDVQLSLSSLPELQFLSKPYIDEIKIYRGLNSELPKGFEVFCKNILPSLQSLLMTLQLLQESIRKAKTKIEFRTQEALLDRFAINLGFFTARVGNLLGVWQLLNETWTGENPPIAKWFSAQWLNKEIEYTLHASPVRVGHILAAQFWRFTAGAVLTSATLRAMGNFEKLKNETGLKYFSKTSYIALKSPFDFEKQGILHIPKMQFDPSNPLEHSNEIIKLLPQLMDVNINISEGVLLLFAAKKQMHFVTQRLPLSLQKTLLIQGEQSKEVLINTHFQRIKQGQFSVLVGLSSFAEGLDLPGKACTHVIIVKIPFAVPDDPVGLTLAEWITQKGGNAFTEIALPDASIKLVQAVGRLIRSETDTGRVSILDNRLLTKSYGKLLRDSLPPLKEQFPNSKTFASVI